MASSFELFESSLLLRDLRHRPSPQSSLALTEAARSYGPYHDTDWVISVDDALTRRSRPSDRNTPQLRDLAELILKAVVESSDPARRPYPAAGAIYTAQMYVVVRRVQDLPSGTYFFRAVDAALERIGSAEEAEEFLDNGLYHDHQETIPAVLLLISDITLARQKYHDLAIRFALLEAGAVMQNCYLAAERLGLAVCALGTISDRQAFDVCHRVGGDNVFFAGGLSIAGRQTPAEEGV
jgi:SagB-type dehydrogenase family enzyme